MPQDERASPLQRDRDRAVSDDAGNAVADRSSVGRMGKGAASRDTGIRRCQGAGRQRKSD